MPTIQWKCRISSRKFHESFSTIPGTRLVVSASRDTRCVPGQEQCSCIPPAWHVCHVYTKHEDGAEGAQVIYKLVKREKGRRGDEEVGRERSCLSGKKTKNQCKYLHRLFGEAEEQNRPGGSSPHIRRNNSRNNRGSLL